LDTTAHKAAALWLHAGIHCTAFRELPSPELSTVAMLARVAPDLDGLFTKLIGRDPIENTFQHHLYYPTHWTIAYLPLLAQKRC
jgi:hypothetical protein